MEQPRSAAKRPYGREGLFDKMPTTITLNKY